MAISDALARKLLEVLGEEAGQEMLAWMKRIEAFYERYLEIHDKDFLDRQGATERTRQSHGPPA